MRRHPSQRLALLAASALAALLAGCGGSNNTFSPDVTGNAPDFQLTITPASQPAIQGTTAAYTVTATSVGGFSTPVNLSTGNLPAGVTATFTTNPLTPTTAGATSTLNLATTGSVQPGVRVRGRATGATPPGDYTITVTGEAGGVSHSATLTLRVTGITITLNPTSRVLFPDGSVTYDVTVTPLNKYAGTVNLSVNGLLGSINRSFNPASLTFTGSDAAQKSVLTLTAPVEIEPQTDFFEVNGISDERLIGSGQAEVQIGSIAN